MDVTFPSAQSRPSRWAALFKADVARQWLLPFLISGLLSLVLPNAFVSLSAHFLHFDRPFINVDYFLPALLYIAGRRYIATIFLVLLFLVDIICLITNVLPFIRFQDLLVFIRNIPLAPGIYKLVIGVGLVCFITSVLAQFKISRLLARKRKEVLKSVLILFNIAMVGYAIEANFFGNKLRAYHSMVVNIQAYYFSSSQLLRLYNYRNDGFLQSFNMKGNPFVSGKVSKGASSKWFQSLHSGQVLSPKLLLIVNESWGAPNDPRINADLLSHISTQSKNASNIETGEFLSPNITVGGEYRELCQLYLHHFNLKDVTRGFGDCLPNILKNQGYKTASFHGASEIMYDRKYWYPRVGFEHSTFFESKNWPKRCYSFPGACDLDMKTEVAEYFNDNHKAFGYWMTLNTHSLYDPRDLHIKLFDCEKYGLSTRSESCRNLMLQAQFFYDLGQLLNKPSMQGVEVLVVGDHAPVIIDQGSKNSTWKADHVSWAHFKVN